MPFSLEDLWIHRYSLPRRAPGGKASTVEGALIRWGEGIGCLQPWPTLGTATLEEELEALRAQKPLILGRRALEMASLTGIAHGEGFSLWGELKLPFCHRLILAGEAPSGESKRPVKVKVSADLSLLTEWLQWGRASRVRVRADANAGVHSCEDWLRWWQSLSSELQEHLDFLEDPLPRAELAGWEILHAAGLPLAWDWEKPPGSSWQRPWKAGVFKPGARSALPIADAQAKGAVRAPAAELVITGMLGHPLGELYAAWVAARWGRPGSTPASWRMSRWHGVSGWETLEDADYWTSLLGPDERGKLKKPHGHGLGLKQQLDSLMWQKL